MQNLCVHRVISNRKLDRERRARRTISIVRPAAHPSREKCKLVPGATRSPAEPCEKCSRASRSIARGAKRNELSSPISRSVDDSSFVGRLTAVTSSRSSDIRRNDPPEVPNQPRSPQPALLLVINLDRGSNIIFFVRRWHLARSDAPRP